jgi:D-3-phosphoglycerate dehydrogenase
MTTSLNDRASAATTNREEKPTILVTGADLAPQALDILREFDISYAGRAPDEDSLVDICQRTQPVGIIVRYGKISARVMDASPKLRVISKHGSGIDTIDSKAASQRGIAVKAAVGSNAAAVAEHTWALILACAKGVVTLNARMHEGHWDKVIHRSVELKGRTLGLIGLGVIGQRVAHIGKAFEMRVIAFDPFAKKVPAGIDVSDFDTVLTKADVLSLHCPLTDQNRRMINEETLGRMREGAILVNTARGGLVDERAVVAAVQSGKLRAAGLDSFAKEPLVGPHIFSGVPNLVLSPHVGGVTTDAYVNMGTAAARNVLAVLREAAG